ncbi:hypothetical protein DFP73DRAFT_285303 [Morchella snyderi]|nr:hypothetical protein DFP73DRAFT_285303 [Morchella snyderi]
MIYEKEKSKIVTSTFCLLFIIPCRTIAIDTTSYDHSHRHVFNCIYELKSFTTGEILTLIGEQIVNRISENAKMRSVYVHWVECPDIPRQMRSGVQILRHQLTPIL